MISSGLLPADYPYEDFLLSSLSYISSSAVGKSNYRYCYQMYTALNEPFDCTIGQSSLKNTWGFIVNQNVIRNFESTGKQVLVHYIDAESRWGKMIKVLLKGDDFIETEKLGNREKYRMILPQNYQELSNRELGIQIEVFLKHIFFDEMQVIPIVTDARIANVMGYVKQNLHRKIKLERVAEHVHLSPERLRHLFTEQMGMPFSQYVLWKRIRMVVKIVSNANLPVSKVCMQFGFTDYSHFSRVFKGIFGVAPNTLFRYCRVVSDPPV